MSSKRSTAWRFVVVAALVLGMTTTVSAEESLSVPLGGSASASGGDFTGLIVNPNENVDGVSAELGSNFDDAGGDVTFRVYDLTNSQLVQSKSINSVSAGDTVAIYSVSLSSGTRYAVQVSSSASYTTDQFGGTFPISGSAFDVTGGSLNDGQNDYWGVFQTVSVNLNQPPQFNSTSISPDPPLIGENVSYEAEVYDSDGTIDYTNLSVSYGGSTVVSDEKRTGTTPSWNNIYKPSSGNKWLNATLEVVDDAGAVTTKEIDRYLSDEAPQVSLNKPTNSTGYTYDREISFSVTDSDSKPEEDWNCDIYKDGSLYEEVYLKEGNNSTYSGTVRSDVGTHNVNVSCSDPAGNTDSKDVDYTVKRFSIQSVSSSSPVFETENVTYTAQVKVGSMVDELATSLYWNGSKRTTVDPSNSGVNTYTQDHYFRPPLVQNNDTQENWLIEAEINYTDINGNTGQMDSRNSSSQTQNIYHAVSLKNQTLDKSDYLEFDNITYTSYLRNHTNEFSVDADIFLNQTSKSKDLPKVESFADYQKYKQQIRSDEVECSNCVQGDAAKETANINTTYSISFKDSSREIKPSDLTTDVQRMSIGFCSGDTTTKALRFTTYQEENRSNQVSSDFYGAWSAWNPEYPNFKRSFNFSSTGKQQHEFCINPGDETFVIDNTENKKIAYEADNFCTRSRYLIKEKINSNVTNVPLYLLNKSECSEIEMEVVDDEDNPLSKVVIESLRYFPSEDKFLTVSMSRTGEQGSTRTFLKFNEIDYKYKLYQEGELVKETDQQVIPQDLSILFTLGDDKVPGYYDQKENVDFGCERNTTELRCSYSGPDSLENTTLEVEKQEVIGFAEKDDPDTQVVEYCSKSSSSSSAVLICDGLNTTDNRYKYQLSSKFNNGDNHLLETGWLGQLTPDPYGETGLMIYFMLFITTGFAGLWKPEASIALAMFSTLVSYFIGFLVVGQTALVSFLALGIALIWRMS